MPEATGSGGYVLPLCAVEESEIRDVYRAARELAATGARVEVVRVTPEPVGVDVLRDAVARGDLPRQVALTDPFAPVAQPASRGRRAPGRFLGRIFGRDDASRQQEESPDWRLSPAVQVEHVVAVPAPLQRKVVEPSVVATGEMTEHWPDGTPALRARQDSEGRVYQKDVIASDGTLVLSVWIAPETGTASTVAAVRAGTGDVRLHASMRAWQADLVAHRAGSVPGGALVVAASDRAAALLAEEPLKSRRSVVGNAADAVASAAHAAGATW